MLDSYCSPSGDYCTSITRSAKGQIVLSLRTFAFTDKYKLCVEAPVRRTARMRVLVAKGQGQRRLRSNVLMRDHFFFKGPGRYKISWWYGDGNRLGKPLSFENIGGFARPQPRLSDFASFRFSRCNSSSCLGVRLALW